MTSWREIDRFKKDSNACRSLAASLLAAHGDDLNEWELSFLGSMRRVHTTDEMTTRQAEKLLEVRDQHQLVTEIRGFSVIKMLDGCYAARRDLPEADEEWIVALYRSGRSFKRRDASRLLRCARELNLIEMEDA